MKTKLVRWGNSFAIRIPKSIIENSRIKEGESVEIESAGEGQIELRRATQVPTLRQLVAQITPENRYDEISAGDERGREAIEW